MIATVIQLGHKMNKFGIRWLLSFIAICALLLTIFELSPNSGYVLACYVVPLFLSIFSHFGLRQSKTVTNRIAIYSSVATGSSLLLLAARFRVFATESQSPLIENSYGAVLIGACFGGAMGFNAYFSLRLLRELLPAPHKCDGSTPC